MRIAISGSACQGKSTLVSDAIKEWPMYKSTSSTYRDLIKAENLPHSKNATKDGQWKILNLLVDELQKYDKKDKVIFDRCPMDNLIYSLWAYEKQSSDIDKEFIDKCIPLVRESLKHLDIIFFLPITKAAPVPIINDGLREHDEIYIKEIDALFKSMTYQYSHNLGRTPFFPADDCPAIIEIFGSPFERIQMMKWYLDTDGDLIGGDTTSSESVLNPENLEAMRGLLESQSKDNEKEKAYVAELESIKEFVKTGKPGKAVRPNPGDFNNIKVPGRSKFF
jgi:hypothetical protein